MNTIRFSNKIYEKIQLLKKRDRRMFGLVRGKLELLLLDKNHSSLRKHKLSGKMDNLWSISINKSIRMVYVQIKNEFYFVDIGTDDQVYKK